MFALIIGVDDYGNYTKLHGAVADAKAMKSYLEEVLQVPGDHVHTLLDHSATRNAIIEAFQSLQNDQRIKEGDPIVIFYAGHGAECPAPTTWEPWGPENKIQSLVSQDCGGSNIHPIPDRTIGALIENIAKAKGNNISIIFDCCHSASGTRITNEAYVPRTVHPDSAIPDNLDWDIWNTRAGKVAFGFAHHGLRSHVLLAACGEKELAYEHEGRGQFTAALLETLKSCTIDDLTYSEVIERIHLRVNKQTPHCEGFNRHRVIFDARVPAGGQVHHPVRIEGGGKYVIGAGLAQGISHGVEFTLYNDQKRTLGFVVVDDAAAIQDFRTTVTASKPLGIPTFAKLTRVGNLPLYLTPGGNAPEEAFRQIDSNAAKFWLVKDVKEAKLEVTMENNLVVLKALDQKLKRLGLAELSFKITPNRLTHALGAASHYYWYLDLTKENNHADTEDGVTIDFYKLWESESEYDEYGLSLLFPYEPGFCIRDQNSETPIVIDFAVDPNGLYGIKLTNNTKRDLFLNAFLFNNNSLSIASYYTQPSVTVPQAPLKQNGVFTIGYGPGGTAPFTYSLEEDRDIDIGYLKIFFATQPIDLSDIVQLSPFSNMNDQSNINGGGRKARKIIPLNTPKDTWFTLDIPVVQRRQKMPAAV